MFFGTGEIDAAGLDGYGRVTRRVAVGNREQVAVGVVLALARGPTPAEERSGLGGGLPPVRLLRSVALVGRRLIIDFRRSLVGSGLGYGSATADAILYGSLSRTLRRLEGIDEVELRLGGSCTAFTAYAQGEGCQRMSLP